MRVVVVGNDPTGPGGVAGVIRQMTFWATPETEIIVVPTYFHGKRVKSAWLTGRAVVRLLSLRRSVPAILNVHLTQGGSWYREGFMVVLASTLGYPVTVTIHGSSFPTFYRDHPKATARVLRRCQAIFVLSREVRDLLHAYLGEVHQIWNALANPQSNFGDQTVIARHQQEQPVFVMAGELSRRKGLDILIDAWAQVPTNYRLVLIGAEHESCLHLLDALPEGVTWLGPQPPERVLVELAGAFAAVLPSRQETFPVFLVEAMTLGKPCIATETGAVPDMLDTCGLVVPVEDVEGFADAIRTLGRDPDLAARLGAAGRKRAIEDFSSERLRLEVCAIWRQVLEAPLAESNRKRSS